MSGGTSLWSGSAEAVAAWAQVATLAIALMAAIVGYRQLQSSRVISREAEAQESFRDYLRLLIENEGVDVRSEINDQQYHDLVVFMMTTFEKIFELSRADKHWLVTMQGHILCHTEYLETLRGKSAHFFPCFDGDFAAFVLKTLDEKAAD